MANSAESQTWSILFLFFKTNQNLDSQSPFAEILLCDTIGVSRHPDVSHWNLAMSDPSWSERLIISDFSVSDCCRHYHSTAEACLHMLDKSHAIEEISEIYMNDHFRRDLIHTCHDVNLTYLPRCFAAVVAQMREPIHSSYSYLSENWTLNFE